MPDEVYICIVCGAEYTEDDGFAGMGACGGGGSCSDHDLECFAIAKAMHRYYTDEDMQKLGVFRNNWY